MSFTEMGRLPAHHQYRADQAAVAIWTEKIEPGTRQTSKRKGYGYR